ncbi:MAG: insulinase family protein [Bacteroidetes bacterium]|nr:insulinase family protein [Bacteroidota bacterium]
MPQIDRSIVPPIHDAIEFEYRLPALNSLHLDNGIPLHWLAAGVQEVASVDFVFPAGVWQEDKHSVALAVAGLLKNGTSNRTAHEVHEALEFYGASLQVSAGDDFCIVSLYALSKDLPSLLPVVQEILTDAQFSDSEISIFRQNAIQRLRLNLRKCEFVANQKIDAMLWGGTHPYGRYSQIEKLEAIRREDLLHYFKKNYAPSGLQIFLAGRVGETELALLNQYFGSLPLQRTAQTEIHWDVPAYSRQTQRVENDPKGVQAAVRIASFCINRQSPDFPSLVVLNTLFGGYFGSRLMKNIREDKGYTYGIYSSLQPHIHGGSLCIQAEVGREVTEEAIAEVYREMELLRKNPVGEEELLLVKNYLLGGLLGDLDGPFQLIHRWRTLILNGLDAAHFDRNISIYKSVTPDKLQALAQQYLLQENFSEIAVV